MVIYKITNLINNKSYIGQTTRLLKYRWKAHCSDSGNMLIQKSIRKYGKENFTIEEIAGANSLSELNYLEEHYIYTLDTMAPNGYNLRIGGINTPFTVEHRQKLREIRTGRKSSEETKRKIGQSSKGRNHSEETKERIKEIRKGKKHSQETREKMRKAKTGNKINLGRKSSVEVRKKLSEAAKMVWKNRRENS